MRRAVLSRASVAALLVGVLTPLVGSVGVVPAFAATNRVVTSSADSGAGTLRNAVATAVPGDTITFTVPTVSLTGLPITVDKDLTIRGNGPAATLITRASGTGRILDVPVGPTVTIDLVTISGGNASGDLGGGIQNNGTLTLTRSAVTNNQAFAGGGIFNSDTLTVRNSDVFANASNGDGAGIYSSGDLTVTDSLIRDNTLTTSDQGQGGGIFEVGSTLTVLDSVVRDNHVLPVTVNTAGGGIFTQNVTVSITNSIVRHNDAGDGGGLSFLFGSATVERTEVSGNTAGSFGGGIRADSAPVTISNVTVSGNTAGSGSAVGSTNSTVSLRSSTVSGNITTAGGGAAVQTLNGTLISVLSSIVANQTAGANCSGVTDVGHDLQSDNTCPGFATGDPLLGPLAANGGVSQTMAITSSTSPAVHAGNCAGVTTDQRGFPRLAPCDIGAFEFGATLADAAPPACAIVSVLATNPKQMDVSVQDTGRGVQTISGITRTNGEVIVPYFTPGTTQAFNIAAVKTNQAASTSWSFHAVDQAGNDKLCA
jgi:hypothetical protein